MGGSLFSSGYVMGDSGEVVKVSLVPFYLEVVDSAGRIMKDIK